MLYSRAVEARFKYLPDEMYFSGLLPLLSLLPLRLGYATMRWVGSHIARNFPRHRRLLSEKIERNLPPTPRQQCSPDEVAREFYRVLVAEDFDAFYYPGWNRNTIRSVFNFNGLEYLDRQCERGEGAVLFTGHIGGVSSALVALGVLGYPLTHLAREYPEERTLPGPFYRYALEKVALMERKLGRPLIYAGAPENPEKKAQAVLAASRFLKKGGLVSMAIDVPPFRVVQASEVRFLGRASMFPTNFIRIAADCRVPLIPFFTWRDPQHWWRQLLVVQEPIHLSGDLSADLQACVSRMEQVIVEHPENWFAWDSVDHFMKTDQPLGG